MNPEVAAAIIAASVSFLTLIGTLAAQYVRGRAASVDAEKLRADQREQLSKTFAEQRELLTNTLKAQSEQLDRTLAEQRTRTLNERFATAAQQLGSDIPAVRLAGAYAMAGLADDWKENRQTCVDVLCAHLRMPYEPDPGQGVPEPQRLAFQSIREVRHTIIRVITAHLKKGAVKSWQGLKFDFTGVVFDGGNFSGARFSDSEVSFRHAQFSDGDVDFIGARFSGGLVNFTFAEFSGGTVDFGACRFSDGMVDFGGVHLSGGTVDFQLAEFSGGTVDFSGSRFSAGRLDFREAEFSGGTVDFGDAWFSGGEVDFSYADFFGCEVDFTGAEFSGGTVDFRDAGDWSFPPAFPWTDTPPSGVALPKRKHSSKA